VIRFSSESWPERRRLNFGGMGGFLVTKLVKPIKTVGSWTPHHRSVDHFLLSKTEAPIRAAAARVLGKTDATVRQKVRQLNSADRPFHQVAKLLALLLRYGSAQVLNLDQALADEHDGLHNRFSLSQRPSPASTIYRI
jgi:hypothetical protein